MEQFLANGNQLFDALVKIGAVIAVTCFVLGVIQTSNPPVPEYDQEPSAAPMALAIESAEIKCLALNVFHEARGESPAGYIAVSNVVMNRVHDSSYPATVCGVVYQPDQFSWVSDTLPDTPNLSDEWERRAWEASQWLAHEQLNHSTPYLTVACVDERNARWYHATSVIPRWALEFAVAC